MGLPGADLDHLEEEARRLRHRHPSLLGDRRFFHRLGQVAVARGDNDRAHRAFAGARAAVEQISQGWHDEPSREAFIAAQAPLLADARGFYEQQGDNREVEKVKELFAPAKRAHWRREIAEERTRRQHRLTAWLGVANLLLALLGEMYAVQQVDVAPNPRLLMAVAALATFTMVAMLFSFAMRLAGRFSKTLRRNLGWWPWLILLGAWIAALFALGERN
jgi:hypothetical protein